MVIENQIPKTETVYELKSEMQSIVGDQIPSFEEFANSYEYDENVASSYHLENQNQEKGYGPCSSSRCTCYTSQGFVPLNSACPVCSSSTPHQWIHSSCGNSVYISRDISIKCMNCGISDHWKGWSFKCERHQALPVTNTSSKVFLTALNIAVGMHADDSRTMDIIADIGIRLLQDAKRGW